MIKVGDFLHVPAWGRFAAVSQIGPLGTVWRIGDGGILFPRDVQRTAMTFAGLVTLPVRESVETQGNVAIAVYVRAF